MTSSNFLHGLTAKYPTLTLVTREAQNFGALVGATYYAPTSPNTSHGNDPLAFVQPETIDEVRNIVSWANTQSPRVPLAVRVGGHDSSRRSTPPGTLVIDSRYLNAVKIVPGSIQDDANEFDAAAIARIGGGISTGELLAKLEALGYMAPTAASHSVGHVGWTTLGGYSPMAGGLGMGVDQIVGAKIVTAAGDVIDVSLDDELMVGIRGAGGNFGVIVELRIKVYRIEKFLAGNIVYESKDMPQTLERFCTGFTALQTEENIPHGFWGQFVVANHPKLGQVLMFTFIWLSRDRKTAESYLKRMESFSGLNTIVNMVEGRTAVEWNIITSVNAILCLWSSKSFIENLSRNVARMPAVPETAMSVQQYSSARGVEGKSSFRPREPHFMVLILGLSNDPETADATRSWTAAFQQDLASDNGSLPGGYAPFMKTGDVPLGDLFTEVHTELVTALKEKYDPERVWKNAVPQI